jgi:GT2 family glycosyltransferase
MEREAKRNFGSTVDIVVPVFNQAPYVEVLLASLIAARNATFAEIIVIDDGSSEPDTLELLDTHAKSGAITLLRNETNLGFTRTVNRGMLLHGDRDVVLLNSDTKVHGDWLDRLAACAYAAPNIATANPITSQFGSHIGCYPGLARKFDGALELTSEELAGICAEVNHGKAADVHTTVGFCMYIRRAALEDVGLFDAKNFPVGYGEESDFCYRSRRVGWRHRIAGDAYVEHFEGKSFGARKRRLIADMSAIFSKLHPDFSECDRSFAKRDPVRPLRRQIDLGRLKRLLAGAQRIEVASAAAAPEKGVRLHLDGDRKIARFVSALPVDSLPNIGDFHLPRDILAFNRALATLGVTQLICADRATRKIYEASVAGLPYETGLAAEIHLAVESAPPPCFPASSGCGS